MAHCGSIRSHICYGVRMDTNTHRTDPAATAAEQIQQWADLANAATEGPWTTASSGSRVQNAWAEDIGNDNEGVWFDPDDAEFIAASRTAVPKMAAALQAVLEVHVQHMENREGGHHRWEERHLCFMPHGGKCSNVGSCEGCKKAWPCPTVRAINEALEMEA